MAGSGGALAAAWVPVTAGRPRTPARAAVPKTRTSVPGVGDAVPGTGRAVPGARATGTRRALEALAIVGGLVLAAIGFTGSYRSLVRLGQQHGLGEFARVFPVGVDVGIVVLYAIDLYLTHRKIRWPLVRLTAHAFTAATIVFNAAASDGPFTDDLIGAGMHAVVPVMFVISVEAARKVIVRMTPTGAESDGVPAHRWLLDPAGSWLMFRRMKLHGLRSYTEAVDRHREQVVYRAMLARRYPRGRGNWRGWRGAPVDERLPMIMAPFGLSVEEALAIPEQAAEEAERRAAADARKARERRIAEQMEADQDEIRLLDSQTAVEEARQHAASRKELAAVDARAAYSKAAAVADAHERVAVQEAEALESAEAAEALERAARARAAAATADEEAAAAESQAAELRRQAAVADEESAAAAAAIARHDADAAEAEQRAAEARRAAAETQARAVETEAQLTEEQRAAAARALENSRRLEEAAERERSAAETRAAAAGTDARAAEAEARAAETRRRAAETNAAASAAEERAAAAARAAEEARRAAAETRRRVAETEARAVVAEDYARLTPRERDARRVARMILAQGDGRPEAVELSAIAEALSVSVSTASERRREAAELLAAGYQPLSEPALATISGSA
ncbi:DUF2637 domain-containing protein [Streptomyces sp. NBC_00670]|uniref:DUF2637 domain-containing protein n=1 Tax=Streptomyces sp. NBC_00670 TaxID=2975804 RepID=UPI002E2FCDB0|nr:DUF2637 domain-containing protein [Streptomyces sp. NBC_00670]